MAFRDAQHGVIAGGDYSHPSKGGTSAATDDGGKTWEAGDVSTNKVFLWRLYVNGTSLVIVGSGVTAFLSHSLRNWRDVTDG